MLLTELFEAQRIYPLLAFLRGGGRTTFSLKHSQYSEALFYVNEFSVANPLQTLVFKLKKIREPR